MTAPAPKPCPFCFKAAEMVQQGCYGCSDRKCPAYLANIVLRLWNRRRPQQSAEPVAWMHVAGGNVVTDRNRSDMNEQGKRQYSIPLFASPVTGGEK